MKKLIDWFINTYIVQFLIEGFLLLLLIVIPFTIRAMLWPIWVLFFLFSLTHEKMIENLKLKYGDFTSEFTDDVLVEFDIWFAWYPLFRPVNNIKNGRFVWLKPCKRYKLCHYPTRFYPPKIIEKMYYIIDRNPNEFPKIDKQYMFYE